jgi:hypothetical protein
MSSRRAASQPPQEWSTPSLSSRSPTTTSSPSPASALAPSSGPRYCPSRSSPSSPTARGSLPSRPCSLVRACRRKAPSPIPPRAPRRRRRARTGRRAPRGRARASRHLQGGRAAGRASCRGPRRSGRGHRRRGRPACCRGDPRKSGRGRRRRGRSARCRGTSSTCSPSTQTDSPTSARVSFSLVFLSLPRSCATRSTEISRQGQTRKARVSSSSGPSSRYPAPEAGLEVEAGVDDG